PVNLRHQHQGMQQVGKSSLWIYDAFQTAWSDGDGRSRTVDALAQHGRSHTKKYLAAVVFGGKLAVFWGKYGAVPGGGLCGRGGSTPKRQEEAESSAGEAGLAKQQGFCADYGVDGTVLSPTADGLQTAARVAGMLLISDRTRMTTAAAPYDSTHAQQFRLLPISHPEDWQAASDGHDRPVEDSGE
ncbi:AbiV family abortive infection protein, partial [Streptomyces sp. NPDC004262]